jgi:valyl-tRNA synthetase
VKLDPARIAGYRNFGTKLWNATRFAEMNGVTARSAFRPESAKLQINRWILTELTQGRRARSRMDRPVPFQRCGERGLPFRLEHFLRLVSRTAEAGVQRRRRGRQGRGAGLRCPCAGRCLQAAASLHAIHDGGVVGADGGERDTLICHAEWPRPDFEDEEAASEINWLIDLVTGIRSVRAEMNVPASAMVPLVMVGANERDLPGACWP